MTSRQKPESAQFADAMALIGIARMVQPGAAGMDRDMAAMRLLLMAFAVLCAQRGNSHPQHVANGMWQGIYATTARRAAASVATAEPGHA